ncbi:SH3 domain-containing protein [Antribacter gilvus]|uniref:SH3 domain-containing protein n=1 Tax=Antribacter gilvus TaxID=2304675 RepID=UPI000F7B0309|nr:SH3 domain-containing protein [Antribacter gilvus]
MITSLLVGGSSTVARCSGKEQELAVKAMTVVRHLGTVAITCACLLVAGCGPATDGAVSGPTTSEAPVVTRTASPEPEAPVFEEPTSEPVRTPTREPSTLPSASTSALARVRSEPSCDSTVLATLDPNTSVRVTGDPLESWYPVNADGLAGWIAGSLLRGPGIPDIAQLCGSTTEARPPAATTPDPVVAEPIGSVQILGPEAGHRYGQGFSSGNCTNWLVGVANQSDTAVSGFIFAPPSGDYRNGYTDDATVIAIATPDPTHVEIYVAPGTQQSVRFQVCTTTTPPSEGGFELGMVAPASVTYQWVTGHEGVSDFGW